MNKKIYLQELCNKLGDYKISTHKQDGTWSKWKSVLECWESGEYWRLEKANNRTSTPNELIIDIDKPTTPAKVFQIVKLLTKKYKIYRIYPYFSGSKGYHIHCIDPDINKLSTQVKRTLAEHFGADAQVANPTHMIALENTPHWKTGNKKVIIQENYRTVPLLLN